MKNTLLISLAALMLVAVGCSEDTPTDTSTSPLTLSFTGLPNLGTSAEYEGWVLVNGSPKSTGKFTVDQNGLASQTTFQVASSDLSGASAFILTIEPKPDPSSSPSAVHLVAGDFSGNTASLSVGHSAAIGNNFSAVAGKYILATPTNGDGTNENSGVWFLDLTTSSPAVGLNLPTLPSGWEYEGWMVFNGIPVSTGRFTMANTADGAAPYSGAIAGPPFPGEDFLLNAPSGLTFPTDLSGTMAVITVEPSPDNSPNPFVLKPLVATVPVSAADHVTYPMTADLSGFPTGTATR